VVSAAQNKAVKSHRRRLRQRGLTRFEVQGRASDKELLRALARKLAEGSTEAARIRATVSGAVNSDGNTGGIWAALRGSPLIGAELDVGRSDLQPREVDL
jgi:hypothetical protein